MILQLDWTVHAVLQIKHLLSTMMFMSRELSTANASVESLNG